jgi:uncharacterized protein
MFQIVPPRAAAQVRCMQESLPKIAIIGATFVLAGLMKGVTGMGLPTVAVGLLGLWMTPAEAAALLLVPSAVTNLWQFATGANRRILLRRMATMLLAIAAATAAAAGFVANDRSGAASAALGAALVVYAILGLAKLRIAVPARLEPWLSPIIGAATGVVTGATGVLVIPAVPYLQALGLARDDLVQALGLSFTVSTFALGLGLAAHGALHLSSAGLSSLCTLPALLGMAAGQWVRGRVDAATFQRLFLLGLMVLGADLALRSLA